jgi:glycosyltransferase involved in cell wall biosynthesis
VHIAARNRARRVRTEILPEGTVHRMAPWRLVGRRLDAALGLPAFFSPRWRGLIDETIRAARPHLLIGRDLPLAPAVIRAARRHGLPVLLDMAENYPAMMQMIFDARRQRPADYLVRNPAAASAVERWCLRRLDGVLVVVEEMAARLERLGVSAGRITIVSNTPPVARAAAAPPPRAPDAPLSLVYLGLLEVPRGILELVEAAAHLRARGIAARMTIVGDGRDAALFRARAAALGLGEDRVRFTGFVPRDRALHLVRDADVGILPHHANEMWNTTIPNKLFDYMAAGLPVITSSAVPSARVVRQTGGGLVFPSGDAAALADAIARLASADARRQLAARGLRAIRERYHWERDADALLRAVDTTTR